jgi:hypothetical protein
VFDQFLEDFRADRDPTINLKAAINDLEQGRIDPDLLKIKIKLAKDPADYAVNNPNKKIRMLLGAKAACKSGSSGTFSIESLILCIWCFRLFYTDFCWGR